MSQDIKIGMQLEYKGIKDLNDIQGDIETAINAASKAFSNLQSNFSVSVDTASLDSLRGLIDSLKLTMQDFSDLLSQTATVEVKINDASIQTMKTAIEDTIVESFSKVRDEMNAIATSFAVSIRSIVDPSLAQTQASVPGAGADVKNPGVSSVTSTVKTEAPASAVGEINLILKPIQEGLEHFATKLDSLDGTIVQSDGSIVTAIDSLKAISQAMADSLKNGITVAGAKPTGNNSVATTVAKASAGSPAAASDLSGKAVAEGMELPKFLTEEIRRAFVIASKNAEAIVSQPGEDMAREFIHPFARGFEQLFKSNFQDLKREAGELAEEYAGLVKAVDSARSSGKSTSEVSSIERQRDDVGQVLAISAKDIEMANTYHEIAKAIPKANDGVITSTHLVTGLIGTASESLQNMLQSGANATEINAFVRPYESATIAINKEVKRLTEIRGRIEEETRKAESEVKSLDTQNDNPLISDEAFYRNVERIDQMKELVKTYRGEVLTIGDVTIHTGAMAGVDESIAHLHKLSANAKAVGSEMRMWSRVQEEGSRISENTLKGHERLGVLTNINVKALKSLQEASEGVSLIDSKLYHDGNNALEERNRIIALTRKETEALEEARRSEISKIQYKRDHGQSEFFTDKGMSESDKDKIQNQLTDTMNAQFAQRAAENLKRQKELNEAMGPEAESAIRLQMAAYKQFSDAQAGVRKTSVDIAALTERYKEFGVGVLNSTGSIHRQAEEIKKAEEAYRSIIGKVAELDSQLLAAGEKAGADQDNPEMYNKIIEERKSLQSAQAELEKTLFVEDRPVSFEQIKHLSSAMSEVDKTVAQTSAQWQSFQNRMEQSKAGLTGDTNERLRSAEAILKMGSEAKAAEEKIRVQIQTLEQVKNVTGELNAVDAQRLAMLQKMGKDYQTSSAQITRQASELTLIKERATDAGKGFSLYNRELAQNMTRSFQFVQAAAVLGAAIMGLKRAFTEVLKESQAFARTMTVMQSDSKTFEQLFEELRRTVRDTAVAFGQDLASVAEIVKQLGSAGLSAEEALQGLGATMKLVTATQAGHEESARAIAGIYNVFGSQLKETYGELGAFQAITDTLSSSYQNHQVELDEMIQGLRFAGSAGQVAGFGFQEITGYLSVLNDNMIKSGTAGRGLQVIFAQLAAKSDKIESTFGFKFDEDQTLQSQFVPLLEHVNKQLSGGALSVAELEKQFAIFGLRGARSFVTLAKNVDKTKLAIREMEDESAGLSDELSGIVRDSGYQQWEMMKQALLEITRDGMEPLLESFKYLNAILNAFSKGMKASGLSTVFSFIGPAVFMFGVLISSVIALAMVYETLGRRVIETGANVLRSIGISRAKTVANNAEAVSAIAAANATNGLNSATKAGIGASGAKGIFMGLTKGGWIGVALTAVTLITTVYGYFQTTAQEVERSYEELSGTMRGFQKDARKLEKFRSEMENISYAIDKTAISGEVAGQKIRDAFGKVGTELVSEADIIFKTNLEIAAGYKSITAVAIEQSALRTAAMREEKKEADKLFSIKAQVDVTSTLERNGIGSKWVQFNPLEGEIKSLEDYISAREKAINGSKPAFLHIKLNPKEADADFRNYLKSVKENEDKIEDVIRSFIITKDRLVQNFGYDEGVKEMSRLLKVAAKELRIADKDMENIEKRLQRRVSVKLAPPKFGDFNTLAETGVLFEDIFKTFDMAFPDDNRFNNIADGIDNLRVNVDDYKKSLMSMQSVGPGGNGADIVSRIQSLTATVEIDPEVITKQIRGVFGGLSKEAKGLFVEALDGAYKMDKGNDRIKEALGLDGDKGINDLLNADLDEIVAKFVKVGETGNPIKPWEASSARLMKLWENINAIGQVAFSDVEIPKILQELRSATVETYKAQNDGKDLTKDQLEAVDAVVQKKKEELELQKGIVTDLKSAHAEEMAFKEMTIRRVEYFDQLIGMTEAAAQAQTVLNGVYQKELNLTGERQKLRAMQSAGKTAVEQIADQKRRDYSTNMTAASGEDDAQNDQDKRNLDRLKTAGEYLKQQALVNRLAKEYNIMLLQQEQALQRSVLNYEKVRRNLKGIVSLASEQSKELRFSVGQTIKLMEKQERLLKGRKYSAEAMAELVDLQAKIFAQKTVIIDGVREENNILFDTLALAEEIINSDEEHAGLQYKILKAANNINAAQEHLNGIQKLREAGQISELQRQSEVIKAYAGQLSELKELKSLQDKIKDIQKETNKYLDERVNIYKELNSFVKSIADQDEARLRAALSRDFETDSLETAYRLSQALGWSMAEVYSNQERATDEAVRMAKAGELSAAAFKSVFSMDAVGMFTKSSKAAQDMQAAIDEVNRSTIDSKMSLFDSFLKDGNVKEAGNALEEVKRAVGELKDTDPKRFLEVSKAVIAMNKELAGVQTTTVKKIMIKLAIDGETGIEQVFARLVGQAEHIRDALLTVLGGDASNLERTLNASFKGEAGYFRNPEGVISLGKELAKNEAALVELQGVIDKYGSGKGGGGGGGVDMTFEASVQQLDAAAIQKEAADNQLKASKALQSAIENAKGGAVDAGKGVASSALSFLKQLPGHNTGTILPGYGGGDKILARLEAGEAVIPKSVVRKFGRGFFSNLIAGGDLPGFSEGRLPSVGPMMATVSGGGASALLDRVAITNSAIKGLARVTNTMSSTLTDINGNSVTIVKVNGKQVEETVKQTAFAVSENAAMARADENAVKQVEEIQNLGLDLDRLIDVTAAGIQNRSRGPEKDADRRKMGRDVIDLNPILKYLEGSFTSLLDNFGSYWVDTIVEMMNPAFAQENARAYKEYHERLKEINKEYQVQFSDIERSLKRNESNYYDYLNALDDAERTRMEQRIEAEKQYQEALIKTRDVFGSNITSIFSAFTSSFSASIGGMSSALGDKLFGTSTEIFEGLAGDMTAIGIAIEATESLSHARSAAAAVDEAWAQQMLADGAAAGGISAGGYGGLTAEEYAKIAVSAEDSWKRIKQGFSDGMGAVSNGFHSVVDGAKSMWYGVEEWVDKISDLSGEDVAKGIVGAVDSAFTSIGETFSWVGDAATAGFNKAGDGIVYTVDRIGDGLTYAFDNIGAAASSLGTAAMAAAGKMGTALAGFAAQGAMMAFDGLVSLGNADEGTADFVMKFVEELPKAAEEFVTNIVERLPELMAAITEMVPVLLDTLIEQFPVLIEALVTMLSEGLPAIITSIVERIPEIFSVVAKGIADLIPAILMNVGPLIQGIVVAFVEMVALLPEILVRLLGSGEFYKSIGLAMLDLLLMPIRATWEIIRKVLNYIPGVNLPAMKTAGEALGVFHSGGVIGGNYEDIAIIAQSGEGVLSRSGMKALGGEDALNSLNKGVNPFAMERLNKFHEGGTIGRSEAVSGIQRGPAPSASVSTSNSFEIGINVSGGMDRRQVDQLTDQLVDDIDKKLAKRTQDRNSRFAKSLKTA